MFMLLTPVRHRCAPTAAGGKANCSLVRRAGEDLSTSSLLESIEARVASVKGPPVTVARQAVALIDEQTPALHALANAVLNIDLNLDTANSMPYRLARSANPHKCTKSCQCVCTAADCRKRARRDTSIDHLLEQDARDIRQSRQHCAPKMQHGAEAKA